MNHQVHLIEVRARPIYRCATCGRADLGDTAKFEVRSLEGVRAALESRPAPNHMPVGWASYSYGFKCPEHVT
jgi:hypothetical protein